MLQLPSRELGISYRICMNCDLHSVIDGLRQNTFRHRFSAIEQRASTGLLGSPKEVDAIHVTGAFVMAPFAFPHQGTEQTCACNATRMMGKPRTLFNFISVNGRFFAFTGARSMASSVESAPSMT